MKPEPINWLDPQSFLPWLRAIEEQTHEAVAAGLDATAPPLRRVLTRREARRRILSARAALARLFFAARRPL